MTKGVYRILLLTIFFAYLFSIPASAISESTTMDVTVNIAPKLQITVTDVTVTSDNNLAVGESTLSIATNNQTGFTATITTSLDDITSLDHVAVEDSIPTLTTDIAKSNFPTNYWGISLDDETYHGMPAKNGTPLLLAQTESPAGNGDRTLYFGAKVGHDKTAGAYKGTMLISAVTNYVPDTRTLADIIYMQDVNADICSNTATPLASDGASTPQYQLIDNRDNKTYWVAKLADGKCWMTQNLDLNLDSTVALTNENTDLNSVTSWTPTRSTIDATSNMTTTGTSATFTGWTNDYNTPYSADPGNVYFDGTYFESSECDYLTTNCEHFKNTKQTLNNEHGHIGNYYNWSAVVASNNTASFTTQFADYPDSICPKGWRLPHEDGNLSRNDFAALITAYGNPSSDQTLLSTPLFFVRAGLVYSLGWLSAASNMGYYWSSDVSSSSYARNFCFDSDIVLLISADSRIAGFSARCVVR